MGWVGLFFKKSLALNNDFSDVVLFSDARTLKNIPIESQCTFSVGLSKIITLRESSILQLLSIRELFEGFRIYLTERRNLRSDKSLFNTLTYFNSVRILDVILFQMSLMKLANKKIHYGGHFDPFIMILSDCRKKKLIEFELNLYQHGVFEKPKFGIFKKYYGDRYNLLYPESQYFLKKNLNGNKHCSFSISRSTTKIDKLLNHNQKSFVALAFQNDNFELDQIILDEIIGTKNIEIGVYLHPATSSKIKRSLYKKYPNISFYCNDRFLNVDILITRYSSLAIEYYHIGKSCFFVPFGYSICIFEDPEIRQKIIEIGELKRVVQNL
jgi:hypothetical protein